MRTLIASMLALAVSMPAAADTLPEAMAAAVESNPSLAAQRQRLNATREALPQAWAEALPQISVSGSATRTSAGSRGDVWGAHDETTRNTTLARTPHDSAARHAAHAPPQKRPKAARP